MTSKYAPRMPLRRRMVGLAGLAAVAAMAARAGSARAQIGVKLYLGKVYNVWQSDPTGIILGYNVDPMFEVRAKGATGARAIEAWGGGAPPGDGASAGGTGLRATGGSFIPGQGLSVLINGGFGIDAVGGSADAGIGGAGALLRGGTSQSGKGGIGLEARGGGAFVSSFPVGSIAGGTGVQAFGGAATVQDLADQSGGIGIRAFGGGMYSTTPGAGVQAIGGTVDTSASWQDGGAGLFASGGQDSAGNDGLGVLAVGGGDPGLGASGAYGQAGLFSVPAVWGKAKDGSAGVFGQSDGGIGVAGIGLDTAPAGGFRSESNVGVSATSVDAAGIEAFGGSLPGVEALSASGFGLFGLSTNGVGLDVRSATGVGGYFETASKDTAAVFATNLKASPAGGAPGLVVNGDCIVQNGTKSAAVPTSRGLTLLYVVEAATSVFEDVLKARLQNGRVRVELDALFAESIETRDYQVFLTARGDTRGLYVGARDERGFEIREQAGGTSSVEVNVRIVGRRKGLASEHRLASIEPPAPPRRPSLPASVKLRRPPAFPSRTVTRPLPSVPVNTGGR